METGMLKPLQLLKTLCAQACYLPLSAPCKGGWYVKVEAANFAFCCDRQFFG